MVGKTPLPRNLRALREKSISLFVSNLPESISKPELEAMFMRAGRIVDVFILMDRRRGKIRGFAFVRFANKWEAECVIEIVQGKSWCGKKIQVNFPRVGGSGSGEADISLQ